MQLAHCRLWTSAQFRQAYAQLSNKAWLEADIGYDQFEPRCFEKWHAISADSKYQGQTNEEGKADGRGIAIIGRGSLLIGYFSDGQANGPCLSIQVNGDILTGIMR